MRREDRRASEGSRWSARAPSLLVAALLCAVLPLAAAIVSAAPASAAATPPYTQWSQALIDYQPPFYSQTTLPAPDTYVLNSLSCTVNGGDLCLAVDGLGRALYTENPTTTSDAWTMLHIDGVNDLTAVSCEAVNFCAAVDKVGDIFVSSDPTSGSAWIDVSPSAYLYVYSFTGISCTSTTLCVVVGNEGTTGVVFVSVQPSSSGGWPADPVYTDHNAGATLESVSCTTNGGFLCIAGDSADFDVWSNVNDPTAAADWNTGTTALDTAHDTASIISVSCASTSFCAAVDSASDALNSSATPTAAAAWDQEGTPYNDTFGTLSSVSCSADSSDTPAYFCTAGDSGGFISGYNVSNDNVWSTPTAPNSPQDKQGASAHAIDSVSCPSSSFCVEVDAVGEAWMSTSSSASPSQQTAGWSSDGPKVGQYGNNGQIDGINPLESISCPSSTLCVAGDEEGQIVSSANPTASPATWTVTSSAIDTNNPDTLIGMSCASASFCATVDTAGHLYTSTTPTTSSWASIGQVDSHTGVNALSCPSTALCVVTDSAGGVASSSTPSTAVSSPWSSWVDVDGSNSIVSISCPTATFCLASDNMGNLVYSNDPTGGASAWAEFSPTGGTSTAQINSVSCPETTLCVAVDAAGDVFWSTYPQGGPSEWEELTVTYASGPPTVDLKQVDCQSINVCLALDSDGYAWASSDPTNPDSIPGCTFPGDLPSAGIDSWCEVYNSDTDAYIPADPLDPGGINSMSCATAATCIAVDGIGVADTGTTSTLSIVTQVMPAGIVDKPYPCPTDSGNCIASYPGNLFPIEASGGLLPYTWQLSPSLPAGLSYAVHNNELDVFGTPTAVGTYRFTVTVTDGSNPPQVVSANLSITILSSWTSPAPIDGTPPFPLGRGFSSQVSCASTSFCMAVDDQGNAVSYNGVGWGTRNQVDGSNDMTSVSCVGSSPYFCAAVDAKGNALIYNSEASPVWTQPVQVSITSLDSVSCVYSTRLFCIAVDALGNTYEYVNGSNWTASWAQPAVAEAKGPNLESLSVSCWAGPQSGAGPFDLCIALGQSLVGSSYDPVSYELSEASGTFTWAAIASTPAGLDGTYGDILSLSCNTTVICIAANGAGQVSEYTSASGDWEEAPGTDDGATALDGTGTEYAPMEVSCTATGGTLCMAVDYAPTTGEGDAFAFNGAAWAATSPANPVDSYPFVGVSCPDNTTCMASDDVGGYFLWTSGAWTPPTTPVPWDNPVDGGAALISMSCPSTTECVAGDSAGHILFANPTESSALSSPSAWSSEAVDGTNEVTGLSCPSTTFCVAVDDAGRVLYSTSPSTAWIPTPTTSPIGVLNGVSCANTDDCVAVGAEGEILSTTNPTGGSSAWTVVQEEPTDFTINTVSCPSTTLCVAGDTDGQILYSTDPFVGAASSWTQVQVDPQLVSGVSSNAIYSISCPSTSLCVASDGQGQVVTSATPTTGTSWTAAQVDTSPGCFYPGSTVPCGVQLTSVTCPTTTYCVAGDPDGNIAGSVDPTGGILNWWVAPMDSSAGISSTACSTAAMCAAGDSTGHILLQAPETSLTITTGTLTQATVGQSYSVTLSASGGSGTYTWTNLNAPPPGLSLSSAGVLSGTPTSAGTYDFEVKSTDTSVPPQTAEATLQLTVSTSSLAVTTTSLPGGVVDISYSETLVASGGTPPYSWILVSGSTLPTGLSLSTAGVISGVPSQPGTTSFTVQVSDSSSPVQHATANLSIAISSTPAQGPLEIVSTSLPEGKVGTAYPSTTLTATGGKPPYTWALASGSQLPGGLSLGSSTGAISGTPAAAGVTNFSVEVTDSASPVDVATASFQIVVLATGQPTSGALAGYWLLGGDGSVYNEGQLGFYGSAAGISGGGAAMVGTPDGKGYWVVSRTGTVDAFGDADSSLGNASLPQTVVGVAATADGGGLWVADSAGDVDALGDATAHGTLAGVNLAKPIVGIAATPDGGGYWMVAADGGVFCFGDAKFYGSVPGVLPPGVQLFRPVVGIAAAPGGGGYWLVASDGGVFTFGDAVFYGSTGGKILAQPVVGIVATPGGAGYWLVAADGGVFTFGDAPFEGSLAGVQLPAPIVGMAGP